MANSEGTVTIDEVDVDGRVYALNKTYRYTAEYRNDDGEYWLIVFPDIPEAISQAMTEQPIGRMAADALEVSIIAYLKLGKELP